MQQHVTIARVLGYAGLVPFVYFSIGTWIPLPLAIQPVQTLIAYAAVVLAFMGATHWGAAMAGPEGMRTEFFIASVIPALIAWTALLLPAELALVLLAIGYIGVYLFDHITRDSQDFPAWYAPMRLHLTTLVVLCLTTAFLSL